MTHRSSIGWLTDGLFSLRRIKWFLAPVLIAVLTVAVHADLNYSDFSSTAGLNLVGNAGQAATALRLTPAAAVQAGAAWFNTKQFVQGGFQTVFQFQITDPAGITDELGETGADGFAFVIQNDNALALGASGGFIGYSEGFDNPGITNSVAVEFDTFYNPAFGDPDSNHISVHTRGANPNSAFHTFSLGSTSAIPDLTDGQVHTVKIEYVPGTMRVFIDNLVAPALTVSLNLASTLCLDQGRAWVGFTAATFSGWENHDILSWSFTETTPTIPVSVDIKPRSCPNPVNTNDHGVVPVAILGSAGFDVSRVDPASVKLEGVAALRSALEDVAAPFAFSGCGRQAMDCGTAGSDGFLDLVLQFDAQAVVSALGLATDGEVRVLKLTGKLKPGFGSTPILGEDVIVIRKKK
jgi:hypothetical protein